MSEQGVLTHLCGCVDVAICASHDCVRLRNADVVRAVVICVLVDENVAELRCVGSW